MQIARRAVMKPVITLDTLPGPRAGDGATESGGRLVRGHHPLRMGDRLYVSYWHHGFFILDISDITRPKHISGFATSPAFP